MERRPDQTAHHLRGGVGARVAVEVAGDGGVRLAGRVDRRADSGAIGAFAVVQLIARAGDRRTEVEDYNGIGFQSPWLAFCLSLFLLSLLGMPPTAGFMGKVMVFRAALDQHYYLLVVIGVLNSAISAYYYLRLIIVMFFRERTTAWKAPQIPASIGLALVITILGVFYLGLFPGRVINALQTKPVVSVTMR